jgi:hypothetical protein
MYPGRRRDFIVNITETVSYRVPDFVIIKPTKIYLSLCYLLRVMRLVFALKNQRLHIQYK